MVNGFCHFSQYSVAPGKSGEAEELLNSWALRMKGSPGFISCTIMKARAEHGLQGYAMLRRWESHDAEHAFGEKYGNLNPTRGAPSHHHNDDEDDEDEQKELFHEEYHGHFEVIFEV
jgi:heme-degrading monooxygenase HmoA